MEKRKKIASTLIAVVLAIGGVAVGASAAYAALPSGCTQQIAGVPYKSGSSIAGTGTANCGYGERTFIYQIHRVDFFNPNVAQGQQSGNRTGYVASALNCDVGSGSGGWKYYGQALFSGGYDSAFSGNTSNLVICG